MPRRIGEMHAIERHGDGASECTGGKSASRDYEISRIEIIDVDGVAT